MEDPCKVGHNPCVTWVVCQYPRYSKKDVGSGAPVSTLLWVQPGSLHSPEVTLQAQLSGGGWDAQLHKGQPSVSTESVAKGCRAWQWALQPLASQPPIPATLWIPHYILVTGMGVFKKPRQRGFHDGEDPASLC